MVHFAITLRTAGGTYLTPFTVDSAGSTYWNSASSSTDVTHYLQQALTTKIVFGWDDSQDSGVGRFAINNGTAFASSYNDFSIDLNGGIHMPNMTDDSGDYFLYYDDSVNIGEIVYDSSDERLKENINPWEYDSLSFLNSLELKTFDRKNKKRFNEIGWLAQDVEALMPTMVGTNRRHNKIIKEKYFMYHFQRAITQVDMKVETHEEKIALLEQRVAELEAQLNIN